MLEADSLIGIIWLQMSNYVLKISHTQTGTSFLEKKSIVLVKVELNRYFNCHISLEEPFHRHNQMPIHQFGRHASLS